MQDTSYREREHPLTLKVMRLTKPSIKPVLHVTNEPQDLPGDTLNALALNDVAAVKGCEQIASGELLSLPQSFGSIYLGETFSCYVSILNDSSVNCQEVFLKTDIQTATQRFQLTINKPKDVLTPDDSIDEVLNYEVKELGAHILICAVTYITLTGEKQYMRRFYKFQVLKPLEVKTKFYNTTQDVVFLEAQVQNITTTPLCMSHVRLEASTYYDCLPLNTIQKNGEEDEIFETSYMNPMDTRQYLYKLIPKQEYIKDLRAKPLSTIGKLDIVWRTNFGEKGRLQTSQLQRTTPTEQDVKLLLLEGPDVVQLEKQFKILCRLQNSGTTKMEVKLSLTNPKHDSLLWCGISGKILGPLPPSSYLDIELHMLPIRPGLHSVDGIHILDMNTSRVYEFDDVSKILIYSSEESPFR